MKESGNELIPYMPPEGSDIDLTLEWMESDDLETLENGITSLSKATDFLEIVQGLTIVKIEREGLWMQAGFSNLNAYRKVQNERLGMSRASVSRRRKIADAWIRFRKELSRYSLEGHVAKLIFLEKAVEVSGDKKEALNHFWNNTYAEFAEFAKVPRYKPKLPNVDLEVSENKVMIEGKVVFTFTKGVPDDEREFIASTLKAAYRARKGNCLAHVVAVYDRGEAMAVERYLKKHRTNRG